MEIQQFFGNDLAIDTQGVLTQSDGAELATESIIRRLLTNPSTYLWAPNYGAGIGRFIGELLSGDNFDYIKSTIVGQMLLENTVSSNPQPIIKLTPIDGTFLQCDITYYTTSSINTQPISFSFQVS